MCALHFIEFDYISQLWPLCSWWQVSHVGSEYLLFRSTWFRLLDCFHCNGGPSYNYIISHTNFVWLVVLRYGLMDVCLYFVFIVESPYLTPWMYHITPFNDCYDLCPWPSFQGHMGNPCKKLVKTISTAFCSTMKF